MTEYLVVVFWYLPAIVTPGDCRCRVCPNGHSQLSLRLAPHYQDLFTIWQLNQWAERCWADCFALLLTSKIVFISPTPSVIEWNTPTEQKTIRKYLINLAHLLENGWYPQRASVEFTPSSQLPSSIYCLQVTSLLLNKFVQYKPVKTNSTSLEYKTLFF